MARLVVFGEILARLSPPDKLLLRQTTRLDMWIGGAEANVALQMGLLGHDAAIISVLPENGLGDAALAHLRGHGVDCHAVRRAAGRMGLYFATAGAGHRPAEVLYDRSHSAFAHALGDDWDWDAILAGAEWLHLSGITAALGPDGTRASLAAVEAAARRGVSVSFDCNFRPQLWAAWDGDAPETLSNLASHARLLFASHRDVSLMLGLPFDSDGEERRLMAAEAAFARFPAMDFMASTARVAEDADNNRLSARIDWRGDAFQSADIALTGIVDRIGAGDAFAAGVLHALLNGATAEVMGQTGLALAALKHSLPGDQGLFGQADIDGFHRGSFDIRR